MSHIFDTLRRIEDERRGVDSRVPLDPADVLGLAEKKFPPRSEFEFRAPTGEGTRPTTAHEPRLRVVGSPLSVGGWSPASLPSHPVSEPLPPSTPPLPIPAVAVPAVAIPAEESPLKVHQEFAATIQPGKSPFLPAEMPPLKIHEEVAAPNQYERRQAAPAEESSQKILQEVAIKIQEERNPAETAELPAIKLPAGVQRAVAIVRAALPLVQRLLPLLDGNFGTAFANFLPQNQPEPPAPQLPPPVDLAPLEGSLTELKAQCCELRDEAIEKEASLRRVEDRLEMVRQATDRNTLEQQELIEDLKGLGGKVNFVALVALGLLAVSVAINTMLYLHMVKVLH